MSDFGDKPTLAGRILKFFPERQIYFRANGIVRFVSVSTGIQMAAASVLLMALGWTAVTSVYFLGRDEAIASRNETIESLTSAYENASESITALEGNLSKRAEAIEERQKIIEELVENNSDITLADAAEVETAESSGETATAAGPEEPHEDFAALTSSSFFASSAHASPTHISWDREKALSLRLSQIEASQKRMALSLINLAEQRLDEVSAVLGLAGMEIEDQFALWEQTEPGKPETGQRETGMGTGGPFIPTIPEKDLALIYSIGDHEVGEAFSQLKDDWARVQRAIYALDGVPHFVPPEDYYLSSRYGSRIDPIKKSPAFHPGVDLSGWPGTKIRASATGTVVHASWFGAYGNMVEIDHGNGFKTRYGHLRKILVEQGDVVTMGHEIGEMGKTGRATDTHVHFEVWLNGDLQDPLPFMKVSDDVFEIQRRYSGDS